MDQAEPEYTMQAVVSRTGVPADTIRSWERRYGFPHPGRDGTNHRVYSDADIRAILRLTELKADGWTTSQAIARLRAPAGLARDTGEPAAPTTSVHNAPPSSLAPPARGRSVADIAKTMNAYDGESARRLLDDALAVGSVEDALFSLLLPLTNAPGVETAAQAFRDGFVRRLLYSLYNASSPDSGRATVVLLGVPGTSRESHLLCHAICLSRAGYRTIFLGTDVALHHAEATVVKIRPQAVMLTADTEGTVWTLARWCDRLTNDRPVAGWNGALLFTGSIFDAKSGLGGDIQATRVPDDPEDAREVFEGALANGERPLRIVRES